MVKYFCVVDIGCYLKQSLKFTNAKQDQRMNEKKVPTTIVTNVQIITHYMQLFIVALEVHIC